ncbi:hypothetical protein PHYBLDRAFT_167932 [Phycomyces blakesleeanus NRRL 1555(-)]|uniref:Uncharacterized protein n=1 Tax=Phycomyces blakesleeanus (strain ATCC 8743b / DSM 1359 / FGSC 10004 / NBRC 33097 / NRRL 1555) TaxID=763407 RepID=A0A162UEJ3_PHYB8|nr:hypothetical protein PHYBLDRAFT_167932 [Phycomyces blakesleeanus NRRL 1555(-)]OAD74523.1 hypothetical protein PHYBLDRAFT_167932 [Phycomyces blakesleeanus NRRL 1555(-)]|eukprot:XP_018292563.1 hypothetical protein PHYBLDRAFT_167932 [Phycomyces blakesleeanus NRRL 1555(-)]
MNVTQEFFLCIYVVSHTIWLRSRNRIITRTISCLGGEGSENPYITGQANPTMIGLNQLFLSKKCKRLLKCASEPKVCVDVSVKDVNCLSVHSYIYYLLRQQNVPVEPQAINIIVCFCVFVVTIVKEIAVNNLKLWGNFK